MLNELVENSKLAALWVIKLFSFEISMSLTKSAVTIKPTKHNFQWQTPCYSSEHRSSHYCSIWNTTDKNWKLWTGKACILYKIYSARPQRLVRWNYSAWSISHLGKLGWGHPVPPPNKPHYLSVIWNDEPISLSLKENSVKLCIFFQNCNKTYSHWHTLPLHVFAA